MSICAENITWKAGKKVIVNDVSLKVSRGETVGLLGPNGCGKSSLLRILAGLRRPDAGCVTLDGQDISRIAKKQLARRVAFVEQHGMTDANMRVRDVVKLGRIPHHSAFSNWSNHDDETVTAALQRVDMLDKSDQGWLSLSRRRAPAGAYCPRAGSDPNGNPAGRADQPPRHSSSDAADAVNQRITGHQHCRYPRSQPRLDVLRLADCDAERTNCGDGDTRRISYPSRCSGMSSGSKPKSRPRRSMAKNTSTLSFRGE
ncbi:iron complex transport system ATP-binding protein [Enterobacter asburiae]|uniref:Iron complex transport system ATP-binding protein n=1 Tax=Enterobacter asburiae TaxID=61645 RepID=A0A376FDW8_ENTAS|nr:iron complex transport system ATP-binding protein [Enterobacter asburiae]